MKKNILEELKEQEEFLNMVSAPLGFTFEIIITSNKTATIKIIKKDEKIITFEALYIEVKAEMQLIVKKSDEIITDVLYYQYLLPFIHHYLYYPYIEILYQFNGR